MDMDRVFYEYELITPRITHAEALARRAGKA